MLKKKECHKTIIICSKLTDRLKTDMKFWDERTYLSAGVAGCGKRRGKERREATRIGIRFILFFFFCLVGI